MFLIVIYQSFLIQDYQAPLWLEKEFKKALDRLAKSENDSVVEEASDQLGVYSMLQDFDEHVVSNSFKEGLVFDYQCRVNDRDWLIDFLPRRGLYVGGDPNGRLLGLSEVRERVAKIIDFNYLRIVAEDWETMEGRKDWLRDGLLA